MAEITPPERRDPESFFDAEQIDNWIYGLNRDAFGITQAVTEGMEMLGFVPDGTAAAVTQDLQGELDALKDTIADEQAAEGAGIVSLGGELTSAFAAPFGSTVARAAGFGGLSAAGLFQEDVTDSRLDEIAIGAAGGAAFKGILNLFKAAGKSKGQAEETLRQLTDQSSVSTNRALVPVNQGGPLTPVPPRAAPQGQLPGRVLVDGGQAQVVPDGLFAPGARVGQLALPAPRASARGLQAADITSSARDSIAQAGFKTKGEAVAKAREALATGRVMSRQMIDTAIRKATVFSRNAARKVKMLKKAPRTAKTEAQLTKALKEDIAASLMVKSMRAKKAAVSSATPRSPESKGVARVEENVPQKGTQEVSGAIPKAELRGNRGYVNGKAWSKWDMVQEIKRTMPANQTGHLHNPNLFTTKQVVEMFNDKAPKMGRAPGKQGGFFERDAANMFAGAGVGAIGGAALANEADINPIAGALAGAFGGGALARFGGKASDKIITNKMREDMRRVSKEGGKLNADITRAHKVKDYSKETVSNLMGNTKSVLDKFLGATMSRLEALTPRVATALKESEWMQHNKSAQYSNVARDSFDKIEKAKLTDKEARVFKRLMLNSTENGEKYLRTLGKLDAAEGVADMRRMLDQMGEYLGEVGLGGSLRKNYFPRQVTDPKFFEGIIDVDGVLKKMAKDKGRSLSDFEKEQAITDLMNGALSRAGRETKWGRASANLQRRTQKVDEGSVDAYADLKQGMNDYIDTITAQVERRRFFKGQDVKTDDLGPNAENIDTVASRLKDQLIKDGGDPDKVEEAIQLIAMRFGPGEQAPHRAIQNFKNLTYAGLLGNPLAAMTQLGDLAISAHRNGIRNTISAVAQVAANKGRGVRGLDKLELLGIQGAATDFASKVKTKEVLNWSLKHGGFDFADSLGKNTFLTAAMNKAKQMSPEDFKAKWSHIMDPDAAPGAPTPRTDKLFNDVQNFKGITPENREDVGFMMFNELSGAQPISLSAMPEQYLKSPTGRMAYMLQSFTLKMFDIMRKDIVQKLATPGQRKEGMKNAAKFTSLFVLSNGSVDQAKHFLMGKDEAIDATIVNNYLKLAGLSKYTMDQVGRQGLGMAAVGLVLPPTALIDAATDMQKAMGMVPVVGRPLTSKLFE